MSKWHIVLMCSIATLLLSCSLSTDQFSQQEEIRGIVDIAVTPAVTVTQGPLTVSVAPDGSGDYTSLETALAEVPAGSTIILEAGTFLLTQPLSVTKAITLVGAGMDRTNMVSGAEDYVVRFGGDGPFRAQGITFRHQGDIRARAVGVKGGVIDFTQCRFTGAVWDENEDFGGNGLNLRRNTTGRVQECRVEGNDLHGIAVKEQAEVELVRNVCSDNGGVGIRFSGSSGGTARQNECTGNGECGISYFDQSGGTARGNECTGNILHGISIEGQAQPVLEENICTGNEYSGIDYFENAGGTARGNECSDNGRHGFGVHDQAHTTLEGNVCRNNEEAGIRFADTSGGTARQNECTGNGLSGIIVAGQAQVTLEGNTCSGNRECGIAFFNSSDGLAQNNECWGNECGIYVADTASPELVDNDCFDNSEADVDDRHQDVQSAVLPDPTTMPEPSFSPITFSREIEEGTGKPIDPATVFPAGTTKVHGTCHREGITAETEWAWVWLLNGEEYTSSTSLWGDVSGWDGDPSGWVSFDIHASSGQALETGAWELRLYIEGQLVQSATFTIGSEASEPSFGPIAFSLDVEEGTSLPIDPMTTFPSGILEVYASFDFEGMTPGIQWTRKWLKDGEERVSKTNNWDRKEQGRYHLRYFRPSGNPVYSGSWEFQLYIQGQLVQKGTFSVQ
jgi:parallel beta-helix repeat protein